MDWALWNPKAQCVCLIQLNREAGLLHTDKQGVSVYGAQQEKRTEFANLSRSSLPALNIKGMKQWWTYILTLCIHLCIHRQCVHLSSWEGFDILMRFVPWERPCHFPKGLKLRLLTWPCLYQQPTSFTASFTQPVLLNLIKRLCIQRVGELWGGFWIPTSGLHMLKSVFMCAPIHRSMHTHKHMKRRKT